MLEILQDFFWWLTQIVYKLIPDAYAIFEFFAKYEFFKLEEVSIIWNNLYIILSVLVLFAIGIKLINSIVNPEILAENKKKSAKNSFFDAVIAVFLIVLIPIAFTLLNNIQTEVIEKNFIQEYIFGKKYSEDSQTNVGQVLAYQTLSAFLYPCDSDSADSGKCDEETGKNLMNMLSFDIKRIDNIKNERLESDGINDGVMTDNYLTFHPILAPLAGILVLYQVILMALDMALRTIKIGLLEMMVPVILGAFIFKREILITWFKEFISTYVSVFLRIMVITVLVLAMDRFDVINSDFLSGSGDFVDGTLAAGVLRLVLIMGILRLVKEMPNVINKLFGVQIKDQGGIKGRLGQMAGVGGLAQKAWTTLGTTIGRGAKSAGKLALAAPVAGVYGGVNALYKNKTGRNLTDTKLFRETKGIGSAIGTAWKTGNVLKAIEAYDKGSAAPAYKIGERLSARSKAISDLKTQIKNATGLDLLDDSGNIVNSYIGKDGKSHFASDEQVNQAKDILYRALESERFGKAGKYKAEAMRAQELKTGLEGIDSKGKTAIESLRSFQDLHASDDSYAQAIKDAGIIMNKIRDGKKLDANDYKFFNDFADESTIIDANAQVMKMQNEAAKLKQRFAQFNGDTSQVSMGILMGQQDGIINAANLNFDIEKEKLSSVDQDSISIFETSLNNSYKTLNGAYQNNGSFSDILGGYSDIKYDQAKDKWMDSKNNEVKFSDSFTENYANLVHNGFVRTSAKDYGISVEEFDGFVSKALDVVDSNVKAGKYKKGSAAYYGEYYTELHKEIRAKHGTNPDIVNNVDKIDKSGILPK